MDVEDAATLRLGVALEADPGALVRVLHYFQSRNVIPLRVRAKRVRHGELNFELDLAACELTPQALRVIAARIGELPIALAPPLVVTSSVLS